MTLNFRFKWIESRGHLSQWKESKEQEKIGFYKFVHFARHLQRRSRELRNGRRRFHFDLSTFLFDYISSHLIDLFSPFSPLSIYDNETGTIRKATRLDHKQR